MKERILKTLEAYLITNRDVMEEEHIKDVEEQIETIKNMNKIFFIITIVTIAFCNLRIKTI